MYFGQIATSFFILVCNKHFKFHFLWVCSFHFKLRRKYFFLVQKTFSGMASVSLAITVNTSPQLDLSKDRTFLGTISGWQLGRDCELPDATFASEDGQHSSAHKIVLISTRRRHHNNRLRILVFEVSHFYYPPPSSPPTSPVFSFCGIDA